MIKTNKTVLLTVLILCGLALYHTPLQSTSFYFDDHYSIESNDAIRKINVVRLFDAFNTRFLVGLSFALNYKFGGLHPEGYRLVNLLIHCLNAFLVYLLLRATCRMEWPSLFGSFLFLCHPIQTEPVNFVTQRFVLMASFFYLLTMVLYIQYRRLSQKKYLGAALVSAIAAMFCKEFAVTLPVMLVLYEFYFLSSLNEPVAKRCARLAPFFLIVLIVPLLLLRTPSETSVVAAIADNYVVQEGKTERLVVDITRARGGVSRQEYFLTELNVLCTYVRLMFVPVNQNLDYDYPLSAVMDTKTALSGIFLLGLLALAWLTYRSYRMISFGILWFFIALSVESSVIPIGDVITEYRPYLASVGFVFVIMSVLYMRQTEVRKLNIIAAVILLGFSILTFQRNQVWKNDLTLWDDTVKKSPHKARPYNNLGKAYMDRGNFAQALFDYNKAVEMDPLYEKAYNNRGNVYTKLGRFSRAIADYDKAIEIDPGLVEAYSNRGLTRDKQGKLPQAVADYTKSLELRPDDPDVYMDRGVIYAKQGDYSRAIADFNKAIAIDPGFADAYNNRGTAYDAQGFSARAVADFNKAIALDPRDADAYNNRGFIYGKQGDLPQALADYAKAIELKPDDAQAYTNLGIVYGKQNKVPQAMFYFTRSIEADPGYADAYRNRGLTYDRQDNLSQAVADYSKAIELNPDDDQAYNYRGNVYAVQKDFLRAIGDYNKAVKINPRYAEVYQNRGIAYARQGDLPRAISDFNKAIVIDPAFTLAYNNRALSYYQMQEYDKAWADVHKIETLGAAVNPVLLKMLRQAMVKEE